MLWACVVFTWCFEVYVRPIDNLHWDFLLVCGYAKAAITFVKYLPQVYLNWRRKSTVGWSLWNVILDLTGGTLSFLQIFLNAAALGEPIIAGGGFNVVKFILSVMSIIFDCIFLFQHYVLYSDAWKKDAKKKKLQESQKELDFDDKDNDSKAMVNKSDFTTTTT